LIFCDAEEQSEDQRAPTSKHGRVLDEDRGIDIHVATTVVS